jgi:hypothetical protein
MLLLLAAALLGLVQAEDPGKGRLPIQVPAGWQGKRQESAYVVVPKDLAAGKLFTVVSADLVARVGTLKGLLDAGKASLAEAGTFKPARDPAAGKSDGGWDYEIVIGTLEKDGASLVAEVLAFRKGEDEGLVLVICDSAETLTKYSDGFTALVRSVGAPKPVPAAAPAAGKVDLKYTMPEGWTLKELEGCVLLDKTVDGFYDKYSLRILILPSEPLQVPLRKKFMDLWALQIKGSIETTIVPIPLMRRLKSGMVIALDQDASAKNKNGVAHHGTLYVLARGNRCVPVVGFYFGLGDTKILQKALETIFDSAEIPGAGDEKVAMFNPADLAGSWSTSSYSLANYVTSSGSYAGDASIATSDGITLNKDGTFSKTLIAITSQVGIKETTEGTWKVEDNLLILSGKTGKGQNYRIFGVGADPKAGAFLVLSTYNDTDEQADLSIPRRKFSGTWFKRKD